jgi:hypothetical protein
MGPQLAGSRRVRADKKDGTVILWDLTNPTQPRRLGQPLPGDASGVRSVAFTPDGAALATLGYGTMILWGLTDPARPRRLGQAHGSLPRRNGGSVAFAPDGRILTMATAGIASMTEEYWPLPAAARRMCGITLGRPVILLAAVHQQILVVHPAAALARLLAAH